MRWFVLLALAGCKFHAGEVGTATADAPPDTRVTIDAPLGDVAGDATAKTDCLADWFDGTIRFNTPVVLANINSTVYDRDPFLSPDELTIWISSGRVDGGNGTIYKATRTSRTLDFGTPAIDTAWDTQGFSESKVSFTSDGLTGVVGSNRTGSNMIDVWGTMRSSTSASWPSLSRAMNINTSGNDHDPTISADGLHIYIAPDSSGPQHIVVASRGSLTSQFSTPTTITELNSGVGDADPSPTPDEKILLFSSNRTLAGAMNGNIWYATRSSSTGTFDTPKPVPDINTNGAEGDPHLSTDGCRIYFARDAALNDNYNIYVATAVGAP